jgi:hypothetical protein
VALDEEDVRSIMIGVFDLNRTSSALRSMCARSDGNLSRRTTMAKRKKRNIDEEVRRSLGREFFESHERTQRILAERIAALDAKIEAKRRAAGDVAS